MKTLFTKKSASLLCALGALGAVSARAEIVLDHEVDPIPMLSLQIILPAGFQTSNADETGNANLLNDMLDAGTATLNKQAFQDKLADYGASSSFNVGQEFSTWSLSFPIVEGKNYTGLVQVLAENWRAPRFNEESFQIARTKLESALKGGLDSDSSLASLTARRWTAVHDFGHRPVLMDDLPKLSLAKVQAIYKRDFLSTSKLWAGLTAPESARGLAKQFLQGVFPQAGSIHVATLDEPLKTFTYDPIRKGETKLAIIVDKPDRAQMVMRFSALSSGFPKSFQDELAYHFGNHILTDSGLGSYFGDEIRNKRGLAYSVGGVGDYYLRNPTFGLFANPVRERADEALGVSADLLKDAFVDGAVYGSLPEETWERQWRSFRFAAILTNSSASGRLAMRSAVVVGALSDEYAQSEPASWEVTRPELAKFFSARWRDSSKLLVLVGNPAQLTPMVQKHFPGYEIRSVPFRDTVLLKAYQAAAPAPVKKANR